jgi:glucose dehydrogenase
VAKNDGSDTLVGVDYSNVFARGGESLNLPGGLPLIAPPYAVLAAIDLNQGTIAWKVPLGEGSAALRNHPVLSCATIRCSKEFGCRIAWGLRTAAATPW